MKVLQINVVCGRGSTGRIATDLADALMAEGHECRIAYGRDTVPEKYQSIAVRIGTDWDIRFHGILTRLFDLHGFGSKRATKQFLKWAEEYDPDVLHLHNLHGYYINIAMLFDWIKSRPHMQVKWTLHDCWAFTGHCAHFTMAKCDRWKSGCRNCPQKKAYPGSMLWDNSQNNFARKKKAFTGVHNLTLITPCKWLANLTKESFLAEYPAQVQYNTIDTQVFKPTPGDFKERFRLNHKKIVLGVSGVWSKSKGLYDFYELAQKLPGEYVIVLVGLTEEQLSALPKGIVGIKRTNSVQELAEIYSAADIFVNPTYEDTYPTVNLEAKACGTPVITYRTGGSVESVPEDCVVEVGDIAGLAKKIESMLHASREE